MGRVWPAAAAGLLTFCASAVAAGEPAVPDDLAHELEAEMASERAAEPHPRPGVGAAPPAEPGAAAPLPPPQLVIELPCAESEQRLVELGGDVTLYRALTRDDFRSERARRVDSATPLAGRDLAAHVQVAVFCVGSVRLVRRPDGAHEAGIEGLRYAAAVDRSASWWSGEIPPRDLARTLRHEQGHFDLAEIAARRRSRDAALDMRSLRSQAERPEDALAELERRALALMTGIKQELLARELEYDQATSHGTDAAAQREWDARIASELAAGETARR